jgi:hypothetical protein
MGGRLSLAERRVCVCGAWRQPSVNLRGLLRRQSARRNKPRAQQRRHPRLDVRPLPSPPEHPRHRRGHRRVIGHHRVGVRRDPHSDSLHRPVPGRSRTRPDRPSRRVPGFPARRERAERSEVIEHEPPRFRFRSRCATPRSCRSANSFQNCVDPAIDPALRLRNCPSLVRCSIAPPSMYSETGRLTISSRAGRPPSSPQGDDRGLSPTYRTALRCAA